MPPTPHEIRKYKSKALKTHDFWRFQAKRTSDSNSAHHFTSDSTSQNGFWRSVWLFLFFVAFFVIRTLTTHSNWVFQALGVWKNDFSWSKAPWSIYQSLDTSNLRPKYWFSIAFISKMWFIRLEHISTPILVGRWHSNLRLCVCIASFII